MCCYQNQCGKDCRKFGAGGDMSGLFLLKVILKVLDGWRM